MEPPEPGAMERNMNASRRLTTIFVPLALVAAGWWLAGLGQARAQVGIAGDSEGLNIFYVGNDEAAYLGVQLEEETDYEEGGARITQVVKDSPAETAGLEDGDIIVSFDGSTIRGPVGLTKRIHEHEPGDTVSIAVVRDGKRMKLEIELGDRASLWQPLAYGQYVMPEFNQQLSEQLKKSAELLQGQTLNLEGRLRLLGECEEGDCDFRYLGGWFGKPKLGVQLVEATPELRRHLGGSDDAGVLVSKVLAGTPAEAAGLSVGDLIVSVGGEEIASTGDLRGALADKTGESFEVEVIRDGRAVRLEVNIPDPSDDAPTGPRAQLRRPLPVLPLAPLPAPAPLVMPPVPVPLVTPPVVAPAPRVMPSVPVPLVTPPVVAPAPLALPVPPEPPRGPRSVV